MTPGRRASANAAARRRAPPANVPATLYRFMGIDPTATFPDFTGRPWFVLDDPDVITEQ